MSSFQCICTCAYQVLCVYLPACVRACVRLYVFALSRVCLCVCVRLYVCVYIYIYLWRKQENIYTHIYIYTCTHIHACICTHTYRERLLRHVRTSCHKDCAHRTFVWSMHGYISFREHIDHGHCCFWKPEWPTTCIVTEIYFIFSYLRPQKSEEIINTVFYYDSWGFESMDAHVLLGTKLFPTAHQSFYWFDTSIDLLSAFCFNWTVTIATPGQNQRARRLVRDYAETLQGTPCSPNICAHVHKSLCGFWPHAHAIFGHPLKEPAAWFSSWQRLEHPKYDS